LIRFRPAATRAAFGAADASHLGREYACPQTCGLTIIHRSCPVQSWTKPRKCLSRATPSVLCAHAKHSRVHLRTRPPLVVTWWSSLAWVKKVEEAGTTGILLHAFLRWLARSRCVSSAAQIARSYLHTDERRSTSLFYLIRKRSYVHSPKTEGNHPQCTNLLPMSTKSYVRPVQHNHRGTQNANTHT
jgi:hypothetical protein